MTDMSDLPEPAQVLVEAALAGGRAAMAIYQGEFEVSTKADDSPVCDADRDAEIVILKVLHKAFPDIPAAAEESCSAGHKPECGRRFFLVDPLDGTKEFVNRNGEFTVNIALIEDGIPIAGIVHAPALGKVWCAAKNCAWRGHTDADLTEVADWRAVATRSPISPPVAVASRSHLTPETKSMLDGLGVTECRKVGSSLKFCLLADAEADFYPRLGPTMEWDTAAGDAVLRAAGGMVVTMDGEPLSYGRPQVPGKRHFENPNFVAFGDKSLIQSVLDSRQS